MKNRGARELIVGWDPGFLCLRLSFWSVTASRGEVAASSLLWPKGGGSSMDHKYPISRDTGLPQSLRISPCPSLEPSSKGSPQRLFFKSWDPWSSPSDHSGHCDTHLPTLSLKLLGVQR